MKIKEYLNMLFRKESIFAMDSIEPIEDKKVKPPNHPKKDLTFIKRTYKVEE